LSTYFCQLAIIRPSLQKSKEGAYIYVMLDPIKITKYIKILSNNWF